MALEITPIVPDDEDDDPKPRRKAAAGASRQPEPSRPSGGEKNGSSRRIEPEPPVEKTAEEKKEIADTLKRRYGLDGMKFEELPARRSGARNHRTGGKK